MTTIDRGLESTAAVMMPVKSEIRQESDQVRGWRRWDGTLWPVVRSYSSVRNRATRHQKPDRAASEQTLVKSRGKPVQASEILTPNQIRVSSGTDNL